MSNILFLVTSELNTATAEVVGEQVKVYSKEVPNPRYVRYGWQPFTRANLINREGLPASTFRAEFSMK